MSHTATTTISRYFTKSRGKALSTGWFGLSTAEFILPVLIVYLLTIYDWRNIWIYTSIIIILFLPVISFSLIRNLNFDSREPDKENLNSKKIKNWKRTEVLKDYRFYILVSFAMGFVYGLFGLTGLSTGMFEIGRAHV